MPQLLSDDEFNSQFGGGFRAAPSPVGMSGRFGAAVDRTQASLLGIGEAAGLPLGGLRRENQAEADASMQRYYRETGAPRSFSEVQGAGDFGSYVAGLAVDSAPAMVGIAAGGLAGGVPGAFAVGSALGTGDVLDNQREQAGETNLGTALPLGIAYGAADSMLGVGGMLARRSASTGIRALDRAGVNLLDGLTGVKGIAARTGVQALKTGAVESGSETFQEGMNQLGRMSVDQDETFYNERSAENFKESAIGGGLLGGLMGGAAGGWRRSAGYQAPIQEGEQRDLLLSGLQGPSRELVGPQPQQNWVPELEGPTQLPVGPQPQPNWTPEMEGPGQELVGPRSFEQATNPIMVDSNGTAMAGPNARELAMEDPGTQLARQRWEAQRVQAQELQEEAQRQQAEKARIESFGVTAKGDNHRLFKELEALRDLGPENGGITPAQFKDNAAKLVGENPVDRNGARKFLKEVASAQQPQAPKAERKSPAPTAREVEIANDTPEPPVANQPAAPVQTAQAATETVAPVDSKAVVAKVREDAAKANEARKAKKLEVEALASTSAPKVVVAEAETVGGVPVKKVEYVDPKAAVTKVDLDEDSRTPVEVHDHVKKLLGTSLKGTPKFASYEAFKQRLMLASGYEADTAEDGSVVLRQVNNPMSMSEVADKEGVSRAAVSKQFLGYGIGDSTINKLAYNEADVKAESAVDDEYNATSDSASDATVSADKAIEGTNLVAHGSLAKAAGDNIVEVGGVAATPEQREAEKAAAELLKKAPKEVITTPTEQDLAFAAKRKAAAEASVMRELAVWLRGDGRNAPIWWDDRASGAGQTLFDDLPVPTQLKWATEIFKVSARDVNDRTYDLIYSKLAPTSSRDSTGNIREVPGAGVSSEPSAPVEDGGGRGDAPTRVSPTVVKKRSVAVPTAEETQAPVAAPTKGKLGLKPKVNQDMAKPDLPFNAEVVSTEVAAEAAPVKAAEPEAPAVAPEWTEEPAGNSAGNVVYFDDETALIRTSGDKTGQNLYIGVHKGGRWTTVDITKYTGSIFTSGQLSNLRTQRERVAAEDTAKHEANPDGPFSTIAGGVSTGDSVTQALAMTLRGWVAKLGMSDMRILLIHPSDVANAGALGLYGPFSSARSAGVVDGNESGATRAFPDGLGHYIVLDPKESVEVQIEVMAHELGHIIEKAMLTSASPETQAAIEAEYRDWLIKTKGMTARELVDSLRNRNVAESMTVRDGLMANDLGSYWTKKKEWFADNVSRWATTSKVPVSVVDRFFKSIADKFRALVAAMTGRQFAPSPAVAAFMDSLVAGRDSLALASPVPTTEKDASSRSMQAAKPSKPQEAAMRFLEVVKSKGANGLVKMMLTSDLISNANTVLKGIPLKYKAAMDAITAEKTKEERSVADIVEEFAKLSKTAQGTGLMSVNKMLKDSTMGKVWAFEPDWLPKGSVKVDPVLAKRFNDPEFSNESRALVKKVFKHGHDSLKALQKAVVDNTNSEYDALIQELTKAGKMDEAKAEIAKKAKSLSDFESLLKVRASWPYAPLRRFGKHVVMAMSARYKQAKNDGNVKLMRELESDGDHYFVAFAEGKMEALNMLNQIKDSYPGGDFGTFEKLEQADSMMGGRDMLGAMRRLRRMAKESVEDKGLGEKTGARVDDMMRQLYLTLLSETSARKGEIHRKNVAGANEDMMRAFSTQGVATAHFIASLKTNGKIEDHLADMRTEVSSSLADRDDKQRYFNEIMARHSMNLEFNPTPGIDKVLATSSIYLLLSNPSYFLMNATQPWMMSHPMMAGKHGYSRSASALVQGGKDALAAVRGGAFDEKSYGKLPLDVRDAIEKLANKGVIQIELGQELGQFKSSPDDATRVLSVGLNKLRGAAQGVETFNRLSTAIAAYRLEKQRTGSAEAAIDYAAQVINETHGDYTGFNAPRFMRTGIGRVATQFRKFQLIQLSMFARLINRSFKGASKEERIAARYALGYNLAHLGAIGGAAALPGFTAAAWLVGKAFGDDEPDDPRATLTRAVGKDVADLLWGGASQAAGVPLGGRIGAGNMLSVLPYTDIAVTREGYSGMLMGLTGPLIGGLMPRAYDGIGMVASGISSGSGSDIWKGVEALVPSGVANLSKGVRYQAEGVTQRNGDVALSPEDISFLDSALQAVGLPTNTIQERTYLAGAKFKADTFYKDRTTQLKKAYSEAFRDNDAETLREVREEWQSTQRTRRELGFSVQPLSELLKAPQEQRKREAGMVGGVGSNKSTVGFLETMTGE